MSRAPRRRDLRQRPLARPPRLVVLAAVVIAVGAAVLVPRDGAPVPRRSVSPPGGVTAGATATGGAVERLVELAAARRSELPTVRRSPAKAGRSAPSAASTLDDVADSLGPGAATALVEAILETGRRSNPGARTWASRLLDATDYPLGTALAARSTPASDAALLRALHDPEVHFAAKQEALVALCRPAKPGTEDARVRALVTIVTDIDGDEDVREQAALRLHRLATPLPRELHAVLDEPWHDIAGPVATALAACGDVVSVELVAAEVAQDGAPSMLVVDRVLAALQALRRHPRFPPELQPRIDALASASAAVSGSGWINQEADRAEAEMKHIGPAVGAWAAALPDDAVPAWDREMRAIRRSPARRRALALTTADAVAAADEADIDVAGATLCILYGPDTAAQTLDGLDRLARRLRPAVEAAATPREKLAVIQRACVPARQNVPRFADLSPLTTVLSGRAAICMGWTMLFVGLGDRLGLPLHAVGVPGHVFVRWDDGTERLNFDPTLGGVSPSDEECTAAHATAERPLDPARHLRLRSRHELIAAALSNSAGWNVAAHHRSTSWLVSMLESPGGAEYLVASRSPVRHLREARRLAAAAIEVDVGCELGWLNLFAALAPAGPSAADDARVKLARTPQIRSPAHAEHIARSLHWLGLGAEAVSLLDAARALNPARQEPFALRAAALAAAGRATEARTAAEAGSDGDEVVRRDCEAVLVALDLVDSPDPDGVLDARLHWVLSPATPDERTPAPHTTPAELNASLDRLHFLAHLILTIPPRTAERAKLALRVLDRRSQADVRRRFVLTDGTNSGEPELTLYGALRRYAEARAAEAAPSANPGAPGGEK